MKALLVFVIILLLSFTANEASMKIKLTMSIIGTLEVLIIMRIIKNFR